MARRTNHLMTGHLKTKMTIIGVFVAIFWIVEILNQFVFDHQLNQYGIIPRSWPFGLRGILFAPFLHGGFKDLIVGTIGFVICSWLVMRLKIRDFWIVTIITMIVGGLGIWIFAPTNTPQIGLSSLILGYLGFLALGGQSDFESDYDKNGCLVNLISIYLSIFLVLVFFTWGTNFLPIWLRSVNHLSGFLAGTLVAEFIAQGKGRAIRHVFFLTLSITFITFWFVNWLLTGDNFINFILGVIGFIACAIAGGSSSTSGEQKDTISQAGHAEARHRDRVEAEERYRQWKEQEQRDWEEQQRQNNEDR